MRLFTAIDMPGEVLQNLEDLLLKLRPTARCNSSQPGNLHITTKYLGEGLVGRLDELSTALAGMASRVPIPVEIRRVGFFPNPHSPRVFWCGIEAPGLEALAADTDQAAAALGIASEAPSFSPPLTLAPIK